MDALLSNLPAPATVIPTEVWVILESPRPVLLLHSGTLLVVPVPEGTLDQVPSPLKKLALLATPLPKCDRPTVPVLIAPASSELIPVPAPTKPTLLSTAPDTKPPVLLNCDIFIFC